MISEKQYELFLDHILERINGDWVVLGGSLLALLKATNRATSDIDICSIDELTNEHRLQLMTVAQEVGLPIEAINPAADYFLRQIPQWKQSLVLFRSGLKGQIYRPTIELYYKLKLNRSSESDIQDCISFLNWHKKNFFEIDKLALLRLVEQYDQTKTTLLRAALIA